VAVRLGLSAVRGVGAAQLDLLDAARADGPFRSGDDLWQRVGRLWPEMTWRQMEMAGAFSRLAPRRGSAQLGLFDETDESDMSWAVDEEAGLGFGLPRANGLVYVQVDSGPGDAAERLAAFAVGHPGPQHPVVVMPGDRRGHRLSQGMASDLATLRTLRRMPWVRGVARGIEAEGGTNG
jgi:hypothetical protein